MISFKDSEYCGLSPCECDVNKADRGWFERFHNYCKDKQSENESEDDCRLGSDVYQFIMSIAVVCGLVWMVAGGLSFKAYSVDGYMSKVYASSSLTMYFVGYVIFAGLFGVVMNQINYRNFNLDKAGHCDNVKKKFRRSGDEFMGYSICGFVLIMTSIICTLNSVPTF